MPRVKTIPDARVLDEALRLLIVEGPQRFTLSALGRSVGLSPSTLVQRFGSKAALLDAVFVHSAEQLEAELDAPPETDDPRADLLGRLSAMARIHATRAHVAGNLRLLAEDLTRPRRLAPARRN